MLISLVRGFGLAPHGLVHIPKINLFRRSITNLGTSNQCSGAEIQCKRRSAVKEICQIYRDRLGSTKYCNGRYRNGYSLKTLHHIEVMEKAKLLYCRIPKVAGSAFLRVFAILQGKINTWDAP